MERIPAGSKQDLIVDVTDRLGAITDLGSYTVTFDVKDDEGNAKYTNQTATTDGMKALCLIDTTGWTPDDYDLWLTINASPESPRLGPFPFKVE